jgi:seryl-tRNA synthetase
MLDLRFIRENAAAIRAACQHKRVAVDMDRFFAVSEERRHLLQQRDQINQKRREVSSSLKDTAQREEYASTGKALKEELASVEKALKRVAAEHDALWQKIPNIPSADTPVGTSEADNTILRTVGTPAQFSFEPKPHWDLGKTLDVIDNERAARVVGSRFTYLKRELAWLELALLNLAFETATNPETIGHLVTSKNLDIPGHPFIPVIPPVLIHPTTFQKMARLEPKEERYYIPQDDLYLVGSAEHTLGALHMDEVLPEASLPLRYLGYSSAFRREAGSYGRDVKGILRMHQFEKAEAEVFSTPETARAEQELLVALQEHLLQSLGLAYRVVLVCTGEMGAPDERQIDIETWMPGQNRYRETHTADLTGDYQARRLGTKVRREQGSELVHMNDATIFAMGRMIIAIMENYQQADGSIAIPAVLHPYLPFTLIPATRHP